MIPVDLTQVTSWANRQRLEPGKPAPTLHEDGGAAVITAYQCHGTSVGPMGVLRAGNGDVTGGVPFMAFSYKDSGGDAGEIAPTPRAMPHDKTWANGGGQVAVAFNTKESGRDASVELAPTLRAESGDPHMGGRSAVATGMQVRRLTPRECLRLQAFPDDWLDLDPPLSDSAKYRLCGNSVVVNEVAWIARNIREYAARAAGSEE